MWREQTQHVQRTRVGSMGEDDTHGARSGQGPDQIKPIKNYIPCFNFILSSLKTIISIELRPTEVK